MKSTCSIVQVRAVCLAIVLLLSTIGGGVLSAQELEEAAYFRFAIPPNPETFVIRLTDPEKITRARAILADLEPDLHIMGQIVKQPADYNPPWGFHLEPDSIEFFHSAIEVCDASILYVEQHLDEVCGSFLPGCTWCPWGSQLVEEVREDSALRMYLPLVIR